MMNPFLLPEKLIVLSKTPSGYGSPTSLSTVVKGGNESICPIFEGIWLPPGRGLPELDGPFAILCRK